MIYFVDSGATPGSVGTPFPTLPMWNSVGDLQATINRIIAAPSTGGDEIWALHGPYNLAGSPLVINNNTAPLSIYGGFVGTENTLCDRDANIISNDPDFPDFFQNPSILDGGGGSSVIQMQQANVCRIDGFVIRNGSAGTWVTSGNNGGGVCATSSSNIWMENLVFMDNAAGDYGGGMYTGGVWSLMIKNTIFFSNRATNGGGGLCINDGSNTFLVNLLFNDNQTLGIIGNGNAIYVRGSNDVKIINNTISGNTGNAASSSVYCTQAPNWVEIYNSIIYPDSIGAIAVPFISNVSVEYCCLSATPAFPIPAHPSNLILNPNFINQVPISIGGDYHLMTIPPFTVQSPCIGRGNINRIFPLSVTDLEGEPRFVDKVITPPPSPPIRMVDMGAFEVQ